MVPQKYVAFVQERNITLYECFLLAFVFYDAVSLRSAWCHEWMKWKKNLKGICYSNFVNGPGSSVGTGTDYGLDGPGIESRGGRDFPHLSRLALRPTQPPVQWAPVFPGGKLQPGRAADH